MAQFDPTQSSVQYGESLLASQQRERGKWKNRSRKIKTFKKVLGAIGVADMFLNRRAQEKVKTFTSNLEDEKANALNRLVNANKFRDNELAKLSAISSGVDFDDPSQWEEHGSVYNTLKKQESLAARSLLGYGSNEVIPSTERERFENIVNKSTDRAWLSLRNKYYKHSDYLGKDKVKVDRRYKRLLEDGTRQILSAKNTSSIRRLLAKFDIGTNVNADLEEIEAGGKKLYVDKKVAKDFRNQQAATTNAINLYTTGLSESAKRAAEEDNKSIDLGLKHSSGKNRTKHPTSYKEYDTYLLPVNPKTGSIVRDFSIPLNHENPKLLDSGIDTGDRRLANLESEDGTIYKHSELYNVMTPDQKGEFYQAFDYFVGKALDERKVEGVETTPNNGELIEAIYKAHQLVRVTSVERAGLTGDRKFTFEIEKLSDYIKTQEGSEEEINNLITTGKQVSSITPSEPVIQMKDGVEIIRHPNGTSKLVTEYYDEFSNNLKSLNNLEKAEYLVKVKDNTPVAIHSQLEDIYNQERTYTMPVGIAGARFKDKYPTEELQQEELKRRAEAERGEAIKQEEAWALRTLKSKVTGRRGSKKLPASSADVKKALEILGQTGLTTDDEIRQYLVEREQLQSSLLASTEVKKKVTNPQLETIYTSHLQKRFNLKDQSYTDAVNILTNKFIPAFLETESDGNYLAKNPITSASGGFQFVKNSVIPALNRVEKITGETEWGKELRKNDQRINEIVAAKRVELENEGLNEEIIKDKLKDIEKQEFQDSFNITEGQQQTLLMGDLLEKTFVVDGKKVSGLGDELFKKLFTATSVQEQLDAALEIYFKGHHTAPDKATYNRARKIFNTYF